VRQFAVDDDARDGLRELRRLWPVEVVVTASGHPLAGRVLAVEGHRSVGGVSCLIVRLPDGSPATVALSATSAAGSGVLRLGAGTVLSVRGVRRLRVLLEARLADGSGT
jgi:hypothetical protein